MKRVRSTVGMLFATALVLAACGSDGPKTLSEDDLVSEVNSICRAGERAVDDLDAEDGDYFADAGDAIQDTIDELTPLKPPKDAKADFDDLLANLDDQLAQTEKLAVARSAGDGDALADDGEELTSLGEDSDEIADSLGVRGCFGAGSIEVDTSLSTDELAAQLDSICATADADLDDVDFVDTESFFADAAEIFDGMVSDLSALDAPQSASADLDAYISAVGEVASVVRDLAGGSLDFDPLGEATDRAVAAAQPLGAPACIAFLQDDDPMTDDSVLES